jgi:predicted aspartyl protease
VSGGVTSIILECYQCTECDGCMRVQALIQDQMLVMLIDSGSSATFISQRIVAKLGLITEDCSTVRVKMANGAAMISDKRVKEVVWRSGGTCTALL